MERVKTWEVAVNRSDTFCKLRKNRLSKRAKESVMKRRHPRVILVYTQRAFAAAETDFCRGRKKKVNRDHKRDRWQLGALIALMRSLKLKTTSPWLTNASEDYSEKRRCMDFARDAVSFTATNSAVTLAHDIAFQKITGRTRWHIFTPLCAYFLDAQPNPPLSLSLSVLD